MGATTFAAFGHGADVREAFAAAREDALYEHGHGGYSGTIAEKRDYVVISAEPHTAQACVALSRQLIDDDDRRISDKWGPAGAIRVVDPERKRDGWYFFGWASE